MVPSVPLPDVKNENLDAEAIDSAVEGQVVMARHQHKYLLIFLPGSNVTTNTCTHHLTETCYPHQIKQLADYVGSSATHPHGTVFTASIIYVASS